MIDIVFAVLNFLIFVALILYFFKYYGLPQFQRQKHEVDKNKQQLIQEKARLLEQHALLQATLEDQEKNCQQLMHKAIMWRQAIAQEHATIELQNKAYQEAIKQKIIRKTAHYKLEHTYQVLAPEVIAKITHDLEDYYAESEHATQYMAQIVNLFEKNNPCK
jgi:Na+-transporting NADH:ubiquinone oxidoreductase subunit NqrC